MPLSKDQMREYQQRRRKGLQDDVNQPPNVNPATSKPVNQPPNVNQSVNRQSLRARLDAYRADYLDATRRQDWDACTRVNQEREPLFEALWKLERDIPAGERYWFPVRFTSAPIPK